MNKKFLFGPRTAKVPAALASAVLFTCAFPAYAVPVHYDIEFATRNGPAPIGSFDYDASQAVTQQFSNFTVTWLSHIFDFTNSANAFSFRTDAGFFAASCSGTSGINDAFEILTHAPCVKNQATLYQWQAFDDSPMAYFFFIANSGTGINTATDEFFASINSGSPIPAGDYADGFIARAKIIQNTIPEPAPITLIGLAFAGLRLGRYRST